MVKASHLKVSDCVLSLIESYLNWKVNRLVYLFGSIAPDINCIYPMHTLNATYKRFRSKLMRIDKYRSTIIRSFTLGVITHYICDYFCYAHNIKAIDKWHPVYELRMKEHMDLHEEQIYRMPSLIVEQWENIKVHILTEFADSRDDSIENTFKKIFSNSDEHINYILTAVKNMHGLYLEETKDIDSDSWYCSVDKMDLDLMYSCFMCKKVVSLIFESNEEFIYR